MFTAFLYCSLLITFATCTGICAFLWSGRHSTLHRLLIMTQAFYALWAFLLLAIFVTPDFQHKILLTQARQLFLPLMMPTWLVLVLYIFYRPWWEKQRRYWGLLYVVPVCAILINAITMLDHSLLTHWFFYDFSVSPQLPWLLHFKKGWALSALFDYIYICGAIVYGIYFYNIVFGKGLKRKYAFFMAFSALIHVGFEVFGTRILHKPEMSQLSIAAVWPMAMVLYYVVSHLDFMDLRSLAQQKVFESIPNPVLVITDENIIWDSNAAAFEVFGFNKSILGSNIKKLPQLNDILEGHSKTKIGLHTYKISRHILDLSSSQKQAFIYVLNDITDIELLNTELSENNQILQDLNNRILATTRTSRKIQTVLSHDLSGSLGGLGLLLNSVQQQALNQGSQPLVTSLDRALEANQSSMSLLKDVLAWAREDEEETATSIELSLKNVLGHLAPQILGKSISTSSFSPQTSVYVKGSPKLIEAVLRNLISNAIRYSDRDGEVQISVLVDKERAQISIVDQGAGMESHQIESILSRQQWQKATHVDGFGIGLGFTLEFIEQLNGQLTVESKVGKGSHFSVFLPLACGPRLDSSSTS